MSDLYLEASGTKAASIYIISFTQSSILINTEKPVRTWQISACIVQVRLGSRISSGGSSMPVATRWRGIWCRGRYTHTCYCCCQPWWCPGHYRLQCHAHTYIRSRYEAQSLLYFCHLVCFLLTVANISVYIIEYTVLVSLFVLISIWDSQMFKHELGTPWDLHTVQLFFVKLRWNE